VVLDMTGTRFVAEQQSSTAVSVCVLQHCKQPETESFCTQISKQRADLKGRKKHLRTWKLESDPGEVVTANSDRQCGVSEKMSEMMVVVEVVEVVEVGEGLRILLTYIHELKSPSRHGESTDYVKGTGVTVAPDRRSDVQLLRTITTTTTSCL
jgi:hypothetical protein